MTGARVLVAGAGVIGLTSAYRLALDGCRVTVVDPRGPGGGASRTNAGWIVPAMAAPVAAPGLFTQGLRWLLRRDSPLYVQPSLRPAFLGFLAAMAWRCRGAAYATAQRTLVDISRETLRLYDELRAELMFESHADGLLQLFDTTSELAAHVEAFTTNRRAGGDDFDVLSTAQTRRRLPRCGPDVVGAIDLPAQRHLDPSGFVDALERACLDAGVEFRIGPSVTLHARGGAVLADVAGEQMRFDHYVVAAGVWTNAVVRPLGTRLALQGGKGYGFDLPDAGLDLDSAVYLSEARVALTPLHRGLRVSGTMAFTQLDESVDRVRAHALLESMTGYFDRWQPPDSAVPWTGLRPMTPSGLPIVGPLPEHPSVIIATGHQMLGVTLAPSTAAQVVSYVRRRNPDTIWSGLRPR